MVKSSGAFDHDRLERKNPKPAATISGPKRLGRRHHAHNPART